MARPGHMASLLSASVKADGGSGVAAVAASLMAVIVANGIATSGLPVFYRPIIDSMAAAGHITGAEGSAMIGTAASIGLLVAGLLSLLFGSLINWIGVKRLMLCGALVLGGACLFYAQVESPAGVRIAHVMLGVVLAMTGAMATTLLVTQNLRRRRGLAMGIVKTGSNVGGAIIPALAVFLIAWFDWRLALAMLSVLAFFFLFPTVLFIAPKDALKAESANGPADQTPDRRADAMPFLAFGFATMSAAAFFYVVVAVVHHLSVHLTGPGLGLDLTAGAAALSVLLMSAGVGKLALGAAGDYVGRWTIVVVSCAATTLAVLTLPYATASSYLLLASAFGFAYGGASVCFDLVAVEAARDEKRSGRTLGAVILAQTIGASSGAYVTGQIATARGGDYTLAFQVAGGVAAVSAVLALAAALTLRSRMTPASITAPVRNA